MGNNRSFTKETSIREYKMSDKIIASSSPNDLDPNQCGSNKNGKNGEKVKCNSRNLSWDKKKKEKQNQQKKKMKNKDKKKKKKRWLRGNHVKKMTLLSMHSLAKHFKYIFYLVFTTP